MELYIIRHGQSVNNALTDRRQRLSDPPLTELGRRQAEIVAQHLATGTNPELTWKSPEVAEGRKRQGYGITRLYCSLMWRALQTAQPIGEALGLAPEGWAAIHEQGGIFLNQDGAGPVSYPGKTRSEILAEFPNYVLPAEATEEGWWNRGYEDMPSCHGRAIHVAEVLRQWADTDEKIAIVSHGTFIDALLKALFNQLPGRHLFYFHYNTAITRLDFHKDGLVALHYLNRVDHLPADLISY